ncbi:pyruvate/2-oxoglutarate dehydrogenase complex dihydrolipoamide dehydrogenase (E3) component [Kribbella steppae]|uniref:Pyruvate/2-oxoglutarate dehydrogenase complex dihydrolipoamide dehydrogenase (E3) component n=1 Tax=Kribbella steppae TaxID=2512223 RepID=A0A4R2HMR1_9ACTN|nr:FAD-dependent oxidoreductase [Kribbella steppae]TCO30424.1 pyruvate/2-oxoglutarate dehydrogenase complex dihydrolipoamide dehydrogenase (E3) component [Kribbella steppae]
MKPDLGTPEAVHITVDGEPVNASAGQTVAAVMLTNGRDSWRTTRNAGRPRGVFCGIGACYDCLVVVNGIPDIRACQRTIHPGDAITTQQGAVLPDPDGVHLTSTSKPSTSPRVVDVAVVGGGPAGIAAALAAADGGAEVLLIDSGRAVGGQFNRQVAEELRVRRPERLQHGWKAFAGKRDRLAAHERITHLAETSVWAFEQGNRLWVQRGPADGVGREVFAVEAKAVVLATGAYDRVLPFPGWDLPGVYSAGAAQALAKGQRIGVGKRVLVAGTGPFLLPVAESLVGVGAEVVGLLEANTLKTVRKGWTTDPLVASGKVGEGLGYGALLARHRIPLKHGWTVIAAHGEQHVEALTVARLDDTWRPIKGSERRVDVDAVCLGFGFTAQLELAVSARCELTTGPDGGPAVVVDANQQTTTPGVFAAGELTGIGGADLAAAEGRVAGAAAAGLAVTSKDQETVKKGRRFAVALAKAYPMRDGWRSWSGPETVVCRCEEVTRGDIEGAVVERGVADGRALKLTSRAGLGLCQGRVCARTVAELAEQNDVPEPSMKRPIAVPVRLRDLAAQEEL